MFRRLYPRAASLHELSDLMPARIELTVPRGFRRSAPIPKVLRLHYAAVPPFDREVINGVPATKALRTILDLWAEGETPKPLLAAAFQEGLRRGTITGTEVRRATTDPNWKETVQALEKAKGR